MGSGTKLACCLLGATFLAGLWIGVLLSALTWGRQPSSEGFSDELLIGDDDEVWRAYLNASRVVSLESDSCGRMQNRLARFADGRVACCRYRRNDDQIQGEIYSALLATELGMRRHLPAVASLPARSWQWAGQQGSARWELHRPVVVTEFLTGLEPVTVLPYLRNLTADNRGVVIPTTPADEDEAKEILQWSDLIVFDYLTGNVDRLVNNLHNAQWNPDAMGSPAHNLMRHRSSGLLVFLDNESGLVHGYRLLGKYEKYHRAILRSVCTFRDSTVKQLRKLDSLDPKGLSKLFRAKFLEAHPTIELPQLQDRNVAKLHQRIRAILKHVKHCEG